MVHLGQRIEDVLCVDTSLLCLTELIGEDVEHQFAVAVGVDVSVDFKVHVPPELHGVDQVAVVGEADAVRAVDIKRLSFSVGTASGGGIAQVSDAHAAQQIRQPGAGLENLGCHAILLSDVDATTRCRGGNADSVLTAVYVGKRRRLAV